MGMNELSKSIRKDLTPNFEENKKYSSIKNIANSQNEHQARMFLIPFSWSFLEAAAMHNAVPIGLGMSIASAISSEVATSTHLFTTATFHVPTHKCSGLQHQSKSV